MNESGAMPSTQINVSASGILNLQGEAMVKNTTFKKSGTANFSHINIIGDGNKYFENVLIDGSQYGFNVTNVYPNRLTFKNVTGRNNFYATIKSSNSIFKIDGFDGRFAVQDGIGAYSFSEVELIGSIVAKDNLLGIRSAYNSIVELSGNGYLDIRNNTQGIQAYHSGIVWVETNTGLTHIVRTNTKTSSTYPTVPQYDLNAILYGYIYINPADPLMHSAVVNEDSGGLVEFELGLEGNGNPYSMNDISGETLKTDKAKDRKEFINRYKALRKDQTKKSERKNWVSSHIENATPSVRSASVLVNVLDGALNGEFEWVSSFDKKVRLSSLVNEDALLIAEQLFYYYVQIAPNQAKANYWLAELKKMKHEFYESGFFDVLLSQANFENDKPQAEPLNEEVVNDKWVQAYPNPFNPTTSLKFTLKEKANVTIQVFDITGRLVQTLTNAQWQSGTHELRFDASNLASGMYFAQTTISQSGNRVKAEVTKLLLIK